MKSIILINKGLQLLVAGIQGLLGRVQARSGDRIKTSNKRRSLYDFR